MRNILGKSERGLFFYLLHTCWRKQRYFDVRREEGPKASSGRGVDCRVGVEALQDQTPPGRCTYASAFSRGRLVVSC